MSGNGSTIPTKGIRRYVPSNLLRVTLPTTDNPQQWDKEGFALDESGRRFVPIARGSAEKGAIQGPAALLSIEESLVLLQSLQQTRQHHIQELFPIFTISQTSQAKSREGENAPPKHDIKLIGRCTLEVGPVSFQDVSLYECRFLEYQHPTQSSQSSPSKPTDRKEAELDIRKHIVPSVTTTITELSEKLPWLRQLLLNCQVQAGAKDHDLKKLGDVVDHIAAGIALPPTPPDGSAPFIPSLPRKSSVIRPPTAGQNWRVDKKKAPLLLLSYKENPSTKFLVPVQFSLMEFCQMKTTTATQQSMTTGLTPGTIDLLITMFLPCRGWGRWENAPDLTRSYRTVTTRRKKGNSYAESASQDKMLRPLPVDPKSDFGPIGGISIPAGMLEPVEIALTGLTHNICARVRALATEIENFDSKNEAGVPQSKRYGARNAPEHTSTNGPGSNNNLVVEGRLPGTSIALSSDGQKTRSLSATSEVDSTAAQQSGLERMSQSEKRPRRGETRGLDEGRISSTSPAATGPDRPLGDIPWKAQLFERLLKRVPKRAFLQSRIVSPVPTDIVNAVKTNNPSMPVLTDLTQKRQYETTSPSDLNSLQGSKSSRKRKALDTETTDLPETTITLDTLEESILKRTATPAAPLVAGQAVRTSASHGPSTPSRGTKISRPMSSTPVSTSPPGRPPPSLAGTAQIVPSVLEARRSPRSGPGLPTGSLPVVDPPRASKTLTPSRPTLLSPIGSPAPHNVPGRIPSVTPETRVQDTRFIPRSAASESSALAVRQTNPTRDAIEAGPPSASLATLLANAADNNYPSGRLHQEAAPNSGYIPPRKILPSAVYNAPALSEGRTPAANAHVVPSKLQPPTHADETMVPSSFEDALPTPVPATTINTNRSATNDSRPRQPSVVQSQAPSAPPTSISIPDKSNIAAGRDVSSVAVAATASGPPAPASDSMDVDSPTLK